MSLPEPWGAWLGNTDWICVEKRFIASVASTGAITMSVAPRTRAADEGRSRSEVLAEITELKRQINNSQPATAEHCEAAAELRRSGQRLRRQNDALESLSIRRTVPSRSVTCRRRFLKSARRLRGPFRSNASVCGFAVPRAQTSPVSIRMRSRRTATDFRESMGEPDCCWVLPRLKALQVRAPESWSICP